MDFAFSEEQQMLKEQARSWLRDREPLDDVAAVADSPEGWDRQRWGQATELGWLGLSAPEEQGGAGMSLLEEAVLLEEMGYGLWPGPYLSTEILALPVLIAAGTAGELISSGGTATLAYAEPGGPSSLAGVAAAQSLSTKAETRDGVALLTGEKDLVTDARLADTIVVAAGTSEGIALFSVTAGEGVSIVDRSSLDGTRRLGRIVLHSAPARELVGADQTPLLLERVRLQALAAAAVEATGIAQRALDLSTAYVSERKQFDRPIGSYQAVSHQLSDVFAETELARSLAYWATWCVASSDPSAAVAAAAAKTWAADAALSACERAIQVHGGIGFTWEHVLHRLYKRARWIASFEAGSTELRSQIAGLIL